MSSSYTTLLGFVQPTTGELNNTWGGVVNTQLTQLVEDAIASSSTHNITAADWTLTTTAGGAQNEARSAVLIVTGTPGTTRNIYAPKQSKVYVVINNSDSSVVLKGGPTSPTTGVTVTAAGISVVAWNSNTGDFAAVAAGVTSLTGTANQITVSASTGAVTLSTPQSIGTSSSVQFGSIGVGTAASGTTGEIIATNNITAYYSDDRLKTRLGKIENALDKLCSLEGFFYEANETAQALGYEVKREVGVSAQQVQAVMPEIVAPAPIDDKYLTVRYERALPLLIEAIKELRAEVRALKEA
jgi:Chaperone of endosialidase